MTEEECLAKMVLPSQRRPIDWLGGVLEIRITGACDRTCPHCTQASNLRGMAYPMSAENFEKACASLEGYFGVVGIFGGNPCLHPQFEEICRIMAKYIPWRQRGLWSNKLFGKGEICRRTFNPAVSNLNPHGDVAAYEEMIRDWPGCRPIPPNRQSRHPPVLVAMQDVIPDESKRWELIAGCDINQYWSAMILEFRGEIWGYFCEVAGMLDLLHAEDPEWGFHGVPITPGWWRKGWKDDHGGGRTFLNQVRKCCHACGVPLRGRGYLDNEPGFPNQVSKTHLPFAKPRRGGIVLIEKLEELGGHVLKGTNYIGNAAR